MFEAILNIYLLLSSYPFVLIAACASLVCKAGLLILSIVHGLRATKIHRSWFFLLPVLIGAMFSDVAWIASTAYRIFFSGQDNRLFIFLIRISWALTIIQYQSLSLFLENLIEKKYTIRVYHKFLIPFSLFLSSIFLYLALFHYNDPLNRPAYEFKMLTISSIYVFILVIPSLFIALKRARSAHLPKILKKQFKILIQVIIGPYMMLDFIQVYPFSFFPAYLTNNLAVVSVSTILLTLAFYFAAKKVMGLRFLNFQGHVQTEPHFNFIDDFKNVLEQLSYATTKHELAHITITFFKGAFHIPANRISLHVRKSHDQQQYSDEFNSIKNRELIIEQFISNHEAHQSELYKTLRQHKILIADEISFSNFYEDSSIGLMLAQFMDTIDADIFLPLFQKDAIIAYIIIERDARLDQFYNRIERDEMVVFARYLSNVIYLLQNRNLDALIEREKEIQEELYRKHQEINQYKESIQSFVRSAQKRTIGIIFYKSRRFIFGNQAAKDLITINPNTHDGHQLSKALKTIATQVQEYRTSQTIMTLNAQGEKLILSAIPHLEENTVIITAYYPEIGDLLKNQLAQIKDPSEWDYLLYLETTHSGKLINQLIPAHSPQFLQFKMELLKLSLSKKALLLDMSESDALATAEIIHHISLREKLHILKLHAPEKNSETAQKIFGLNPLFGNSNEQPLLEKLSINGTLLIQNVHLLEIETQNYVAELIKYGFYRRIKSEQKHISSVRIICTSHADLVMLTKNGKFSPELFGELKKTTLTLPSLVSLPEDELADLAHGFSEQAIKAEPLKNFLELTEQEKHKIINSRPVSLSEFKQKIEQFLVNKSKKSHIYHEAQFDPAYNVTDPDLVQAARLGRKALKDPKIMSLLWEKFGNQNQIATFLGVNRSSVNRRCKEYNFI